MAVFGAGFTRASSSSSSPPSTSGRRLDDGTTTTRNQGEASSIIIIAHHATVSFDADVRAPLMGDLSPANSPPSSFTLASRGRRDRVLMTHGTRVRAPMRFGARASASGKPDATFNVVEFKGWDDVGDEDDGEGEEGDACGHGAMSSSSSFGRKTRELWKRIEPDAHAVGAAICLSVAFPETARRARRVGAALCVGVAVAKSIETETSHNVEWLPKCVVDPPRAARRAMRASLLTTCASAALRTVAPRVYADATAAAALASVKVLFKQPPLREGLARAMRGARGEFREEERIALWHARYRWAALRLARHVPRDPTRTLTRAPLMGILAFVRGMSMSCDRNGGFSMSLPTFSSVGGSKRARRARRLGAARAIETETKYTPDDVLNAVRASLSLAGDVRALRNASGAVPVEEERALDVVGGDRARSQREEEEEEDADSDDEANIWQDDRLITATWATNGWSFALALRAFYLILTWLPVLTYALPLLIASRAAPTALGVRMRKRAWATLHSAIALCGAAFIKWAQWASTREDIFPRDLCEQLEKLHDDAPRHSYRRTLRILERELGCDPRLVFCQFPTKPMASGSVAQVYRARLRKEIAAVCARLASPRVLDLNEDGTMDVAVKVRHPNVAKRIFLDFQILRAVAGFADTLPALKGLHLKNTLGQFSHTMTAQTDLRNEAVHLLKFTHNMKDEVRVRSPRPVPGLVTEAVLVETFVKGEGLGDAIKRKSIHNSELCSLGVYTYMLMLLRDNFIHQDLHPGNILYSVDDANADGTTGGATTEPQAAQIKLDLIDFGIADELPQIVRNRFIGFLCFLIRGEGDKAADVALTWDGNQTCRDRDALRADMARLVSEKGDVFSRRVNLDELLKEIMRLFRKHGVSIDGVYASLVVSLCVLVGFATSLDPQVNLFEVAAPSVMAFALTGDVMGRLFEA